MIDQSNVAVLFIDVQEKLAMHMDQVDALKINLKLAINAFNILELPIIVTEQYPKGLGPTVPELKELFNSNAQVYKKTSFSALKDSTISKEIEALKKDYWILIGIESHICVMQSAFDLNELGKSVIVLDECITSRNPNHKKIAIQEMCKKNIRITCTESLLFELLGHAKHSKFKEISTLMR